MMCGSRQFAAMLKPLAQICKSNWRIRDRKDAARFNTYESSTEVHMKGAMWVYPLRSCG